MPEVAERKKMKMRANTFQRNRQSDKRKHTLSIWHRSFPRNLAERSLRGLNSGGQSIFLSFSQSPLLKIATVTPLRKKMNALNM